MATSKHGKDSHSRGRKRNEKSNSAKKIIVFIVFILTISIAVAVVMNMRKDKLFGTWTTDGITIYKFNGKGEGSLVTSLSRYEFNYKIKKNKLYIDFLSDKAKDASYEFSIDEDKLVVDGIDETTGNYTMTKK